MEKILVKTKELAALLEESDIIIRHKAAKKALDESEEVQELIGAFNLAKMALMNESNKEKPDAEMVEKYRGETTSVYEKIVAHPVMMEMNEADIALEDLMKKINMIIQSSISDASACTHDCSTCGGCH